MMPTARSTLGHLMKSYSRSFNQIQSRQSVGSVFVVIGKTLSQTNNNKGM